MADNQNTNARRQAEADQKDDDPFAELARIVGFDEDKNKDAAPAAAEPSAPVDDDLDAGLNLEAELLRELERDVGGQADAPVEQTALPESTFGTGRETAPAASDAPLATGPSFFDPPAGPAVPESELPKPAAPPPQAPAETAVTPERSAWPGASKPGGPAASLEDELQAAFSALEESGPGPASPSQPIRESEELASAYRTFEENVEAAIPKATLPEATMPEATMPDVAPVDDDAVDVNDLLLAEMIDVEAEATEAAGSTADMPFDPAGIADSDDVPEPMVDLDVPHFEPDETTQAPAGGAEFGLPLEEELEVLASEASGAPAGSEQAAHSHYSSGPEDELDDVLDGIDDGFDLMDEAEDGVPHDPDGLEAFPEETYEDYDDLPLDHDDEFAIDEDDLSVPEYEAIVESGSDHSNQKGMIAAFAVIGFVVVGGAGFYLWNSSLGGNAGADGPRVIAADNEPVKIKPDSPGGKTVPNQDLAVYDRVAGTESETPPEQNLVNTTEEPIDVIQRTLDPETLPLEGRGETPPVAVKSEDRLAASQETESEDGGGSAASAMSPRKVRTLVVKPDGTIVARETPPAADLNSGTSAGSDSDSGTAASSASTVTQVPASTTEIGTVALAPASSTAPAGNTTGADNATAVNGTATTGATEAASASTNEGTTVAATPEALPPIENDLRDTGTVPVPGSKPGGQSVTTAAVASTDTARPVAAAPVPASRPTQQPVAAVENAAERSNSTGSAQVSNPGGYVMQISSQPSEAGARESYRNLSARYASIIGGRGVSIQRADIPNRGIFYRVRIPAGTKAEATNLCNRYKAAGGSCFVAR